MIFMNFNRSEKAEILDKIPTVKKFYSETMKHEIKHVLAIIEDVSEKKTANIKWNSFAEVPHNMLSYKYNIITGFDSELLQFAGEPGVSADKSGMTTKYIFLYISHLV